MNNELKFQSLQSVLKHVSELSERDISLIAISIANREISEENKVAILDNLVRLYLKVCPNEEQRICSATYKPMKSGYVWRDGEKYFSTTELAAQFLRGVWGYDSSMSDEEILNEAYEAEDMYYTEFE